MKIAALLFVSGLTALSMTAVNAGPRKPVVAVKDDAVNRCNVNLWPGFSATPCRPPPGVTSYIGCTDFVRDRGWDPRAAWWYCGSVQFTGPRVDESGKAGLVGRHSPCFDCSLPVLNLSSTKKAPDDTGAFVTEAFRRRVLEHSVPGDDRAAEAIIEAHPPADR
jgi:hypothetical protein